MERYTETGTVEPITYDIDNNLYDEEKQTITTLRDLCTIPVFYTLCPIARPECRPPGKESKGL